MAKDFDSLFKLAQEKGPKKIAVAAAQDEDVLGAVKIAYEKGIATPILVGDREAIERIAKNMNFDLSSIMVIDEKDGSLAARKATELVSSGVADVLMKGLIDTSVIMKQVLDSEIGLRTGNVISHVAVFDVPTYHKVFIVTDAAMIIAPDLNQKKQIIENAVELAHSLDIKEPKVAVLAAKEKVSEKMEATVHAAKLAEMNKQGEIIGCLIDGPFALDNAVNKEVLNLKSCLKDYIGAMEESNRNALEDSQKRYEKSNKKLQNLRKYLNKQDDDVLNRYLVRIKTSMTLLNSNISPDQQTAQ